MNLTPQWRLPSERAGYEVKHWSEIGAHNAPDTIIMEWARQQGYVVFTHDLDYGALLYATGASAPSVVQVRGDDVRPEAMAASVLKAFAETEQALLSGALITIDAKRLRISILPLGH